MTADEPQDFDEFDNLVEEHPADDSFEDAVAAKPKKKSSGVLIVVLFAIIGVAGGAVWFLFLNPGKQAPIQAPSPVAAATPSPSPAVDTALPPGVSPMEPAQQAGIVVPPPAQPDTPVDTTKPPVDATNAAPSPIPSPNDTTKKPDAPLNGTTAEALPPPALLPTPDEKPVDGVTPPTDSAKEMPAAEPKEVAKDNDVIAAQLPTPTAEVTSPLPEKSIDVAKPVEPATAMPAPMDTTAIAPVAAMAPVDTASADRLTKVEQQLQEMSNEIAKVAAAPAPAGVAPATDPALNDKLKILTDKLDDLAKQVAGLDERTTTLAMEMQNHPAEAVAPAKKKAEKITPVPEASAEDTQAVDEAPAEPTPAAETIKPVEKKEAAPKKKAAPKKSTSVSTSHSNGWELRGAQPGAAWLGRVGSGEMSRYGVGQTVPGLGTIQSVTQQNGLWVVKASGGTVKE